MVIGIAEQRSLSLLLVDGATLFYQSPAAAWSDDTE